MVLLEPKGLTGETAPHASFWVLQAGGSRLQPPSPRLAPGGAGPVSRWLCRGSGLPHRGSGFRDPQPKSRCPGRLGLDPQNRVSKRLKGSASTHTEPTQRSALTHRANLGAAQRWGRDGEVVRQQSEVIPGTKSTWQSAPGSVPSSLHISDNGFPGKFSLNVLVAESNKPAP